MEALNEIVLLRAYGFLGFILFFGMVGCALENFFNGDKKRLNFYMFLAVVLLIIALAGSIN